MPYTLKVRFTGLVAYVPKLRNKDKKSADFVWALLVNAREDAINRRRGTDFAKAGFPNVRFHSAAIRYSVKNVLGYKKDAKAPELESIRAILSEDVSILFPRGRHGVELGSGRRGDAKTPQSKKALADFTWIADMEQIDPHSSKVHAACIATPATDETWRRVGARIRIDRGTLCTKDVARNDNNVPIIFGFKKNKARSNYQQALAREVEWTVGPLNAPIKLRFEGSKGRPLELKPAPGEATVLVEVMNVEPLMFIDRTAKDVDTESFRWFYELSKNAVKGNQPKPPTPVPYNEEMNRPFCTSVRMVFPT